MEEQMRSALALAALFTIPILVIVQRIKLALPPEFSSKYYPIIALGVSMVGGAGLALLLGGSWQLGVLAGLLCGVGANAEYAYGKTMEARSRKYQ